MSDEVHFSKTLFSMSAPGADYFELVVIFQHVCADLLAELTSLNRFCSHVVELHVLNI